MKDSLPTEIKTLLSAAIVSETDPQGNITYVNENFIKKFGYKKSEILGQTHKVLNSQFHSPEFFKNLWQTIKKGKIWRGAIRDLTKDGECVWIDYAIVPISNTQGKIIKYKAIGFDVTSYLE